MPETLDGDCLRIGVLVSGGGTTLVNFLRERDAGRLPVEIPLVLADRECGGIARAVHAGIPCEVVPRRSFASTADFSAAMFERLRKAQVDLVTLADSSPESTSRPTLNNG